ncbi:hypothetical protein SeMB42_g05716 [Synchytrium endobioticum]|uniref:Uncharacterized protein n=1 Tax=Synchytrium endobioticum TaxID=286115 RepID=A0A507CPS3_9FUNG|nr:hypothetical protein SeMB42_g05716 [Synchytrium endobioticum]
MWTTNIALLSLSAGLGLCIPNEAAARSHLPIGDADMDPSASQSMLVPHSGGPDHPISMGNGAVGCTSDSSKLNALLASGGAMSTVRSMTDMAVFTFSHANTMESGSGHSTTRGANAVDLYKHHGLSRLSKRGARLYICWLIRHLYINVKMLVALGFLAAMAVAVVACIICNCRNRLPVSSQNAESIEPPGLGPIQPPNGRSVLPSNAGLRPPLPAVTQPRGAGTSGVGAGPGRNHLPPMMHSSAIRPGSSTLGSPDLESRFHDIRGGDSFPGMYPHRSVGGAGRGSGRLPTGRD